MGCRTSLVEDWYVVCVLVFEVRLRTVCPGVGVLSYPGVPPFCRFLSLVEYESPSGRDSYSLSCLLHRHVPRIAR